MSLSRLDLAPVLGVLSLLVCGCSDPVPPTPRGGFDVNWVDSPVEECPIRSHRAQVGSPTATDPGTKLVDGEEGAEIECSVTGAGPFKVSASAVQGANILRLNIPSISPSASQAAPASGSVNFRSAELTSGSVSSDSTVPCTFWFPDGRSEDQRVTGGKIWVAFECSRMLTPPMNNPCKISESYALFENCDTGEEE
ncbi:hypothetical protein [Chondromyces apiculatus]|uniref:Uncharacterized protein n=1 Tax=Chondromyces apiculatus DSM 436 TaxID=1192034 RepID=A0A017SXV6_9BACT|nr:hypothetical protein [Chondromyces apiculatus]EYF01829.1 Hypothetical protein CAP_7782 [Chondromyces apiculatus DSM 436]